MNRTLVLLAPAILVACGSASIRGGETAPPGREPSGRVLAGYTATECRDASGGPQTAAARIFLVDEGAGNRFLVETRPSYDSIVVRNHFGEGQEQVYQVLLETSDGRKILRDYRLPASGSGEGRMATGESFALTDVPEPALRGKLRSTALVCKLTPDTAEPAPAAATPPPPADEPSQ